MKTAFITGANKGIGFETARQLLHEGYYVYLGSRNLANGNLAVEKLKKEGFENLEAIQIDVTQQSSVDDAKETLAAKISQLDVLINNAGISGGPPFSAIEVSETQFEEVFNTNVFGVSRVTNAMIDLLKKSENGRVVNVSSSVGSLTLQGDPNWPPFEFAKMAVYGASKAALNMLTVQYAFEFRNTNIKVNSVCPGYTQTDFTGHQGGEVSLAANRIIKYAIMDEKGPSGRFFSEESNPQTGEIPW